MTSNFLGQFPQVALALAFSFGCALAMAFVCLRIVVSWVTREQYNVTDAPRRVSVVVYHGHDIAGASAIDAPIDSAVDGGSGVATGGPYLLPPRGAQHGFARAFGDRLHYFFEHAGWRGSHQLENRFRGELAAAAGDGLVENR